MKVHGSRFPLRWLIVACVAGAVLATASSVAAQSRPDVDVQTFEPTLQPNGIFTIDRSSTLDHLQPAGTLVLDYLSEPLVEGEDANARPIVDQQLAADLVAGVGLFDRFDVAVHLPVYMVNDARWPNSDPGGFSVGDLAITPKGRIVSQETAGIGLAASVRVSFPTGSGQDFVGASTVTATPELIIDRTFGDLALAGNFGFRFQGDETLGNLNVGDAFLYSVGAEYEIVDGLLKVGGELNGSTQLSNFFGSDNESPLELLLGAKIMTDSGFAIMAGSGGGLSPGIGAPEFRAFLGISYPTGKQDTDGDGLLDSDDECPDEPEDLDGFEDNDGCPDTDNDGDGIEDDADKCPEKPEDKNGYQDDDGCPDASTDTDGDGIVDMDDDCPKKPEDKNGYQDEDGCPDGDADADGDGVADVDDECQDEPEDKDGFEDADGCPDPDNDNDRIADADDECPDEAGVAAQQGCPPKEKKVVREEKEIKILEKVYFEKDSAKIKERSHALLDQVALVLRQNADITRVEIQGHTDDSGSTSYNQELSQKRADSVMNYLVKEAGIDVDRLVARGYGEAKPLVENTSDKNRAKNRRVEFKILEQGGDTTGSADGSGDGDGADSDGNAGSEEEDGGQ